MKVRRRFPSSEDRKRRLENPDYALAYLEAILVPDPDETPADRLALETVAMRCVTEALGITAAQDLMSRAKRGADVWR